MKKLLLIVILFLIKTSIFAQTPAWVWAVPSGGGTSSNVATHMAREATGNLYLTSDFEGTRLFGSSNMTAYGQNDMFVSKYDFSGTLLWSQHYGAASTYTNNGGIGVDAAGNIYVAGNFGFNIFVDANNTFSTVGQNDIVLVKLDTLGNVIWAKQFGGTGNDVAYSLAVEGNNIVMVGSYSAAFSANSVNLPTPSASQEDIFILKFDTSGTCQWGKGIGGTSADRALCTTISSSNIYVSGYFQSTVLFGTVSLTSSGGNDMFIAKYDLNGNQIWAKKAGGTGTDQGNGISCDANGNAYVTGLFYASTNFGLTPGGTSVTLVESPTGYGDGFVARYNSADGTCAWARKIHSANADQGVAISTDPLGGSFVTGYYGNTATVQSGPSSTVSLTTHGSNDCFVVKYNQNGNLIWDINIGGTGDDRGKGILYDATGYCNIGGYFASTVAFGTAGSLTAPSGIFTMFLGRLNGFTTGLQVINKEFSVDVYPNPAIDKMHVSIPEQESISAIELYNIQGELVRSTPVILTTNEFTFDLTGIASGSYVVSVISKTGIGTKMIQVH